jgi:hypothetical protein
VTLSIFLKDKNRKNSENKQGSWARGQEEKGFQQSAMVVLLVGAEAGIIPAAKLLEVRLFSIISSGPVLTTGNPEP